MAEFCGTVEESRSQLENVDWSKVGQEKCDEVFNQIQKSLDTAENDISAARRHFHKLCDQMEEVIFSLSSYKKQNRYFEERVKEITTEKLFEYKDFADTVKARFDFERTDEQRKQRTERLQQWE